MRPRPFGASVSARVGRDPAPPRAAPRLSRVCIVLPLSEGPVAGAICTRPFRLPPLLSNVLSRFEGGDSMNVSHANGPLEQRAQRPGAFPRGPRAQACARRECLHLLSGHPYVETQECGGAPRGRGGQWALGRVSSSPLLCEPDSGQHPGPRWLLPWLTRPAGRRLVSSPWNAWTPCAEPLQMSLFSLKQSWLGCPATNLAGSPRRKFMALVAFQEWTRSSREEPQLTTEEQRPSGLSWSLSSAGFKGCLSSRLFIKCSADGRRGRATASGGRGQP